MPWQSRKRCSPLSVQRGQGRYSLPNQFGICGLVLVKTGTVGEEMPVAAIFEEITRRACSLNGSPNLADPVVSTERVAGGLMHLHGDT
jgi:hypothetical protein